MAFPLVRAALSLALCLSAPAAAAVVCTHGEARRSVDVESSAEPAPVPCVVRYTKQPEGVDTVLWSAERDRGFCEDRAADLVERLEGAGWSCVASTREPPPVSAGPPPTIPPVSANRPPPAARAVAPPVSRQPAPDADPDPMRSSPAAAPALPKTPVASIEAPPPVASDPTPAGSLRERIVHDPRMRFYRQSYGETALRDGLRLVPVDLNGDGRDELFVQVDLAALCDASPCTWDLFELAEDGSLASLGVRQVVDWRALGSRSQGFPDLAVRTLAPGEAEYRVYRFELGMYRSVEDRVSSEIFAIDDERLPPVSAP